MVANISQLLGALVVAFGLYLAWLPLGVVALGLIVFLVGLALEGGK